jgi:spore maturation protein CgeB
MKPLSIVFIGLSLSSSWGNGHATTYRSLIRGLDQFGHDVLFLEHTQPWYLEHRDVAAPDYCELRHYDDLGELSAYRERIVAADAVIVGSYVPDGVEVLDLVSSWKPQLLCFYDIDTPVTLTRLAAGEPTYIEARQIRELDVYLSFSGGRALERLRGDFGARRALPLYCSVDAHAYRPTGEAKQWDLGYLGTYSDDRQPGLHELLLRTADLMPRARFVVAGSQYPDTIRWPSNVERIEHLPPHLHASFYSRQRFTLNITRADMIAIGSSPSVRLFEAAACAVPVISDRWEGLDAFFPEPAAIATAARAEEVVSVLSRGEGAAKAQGEEARRIALARHTGLVRAGELAAAIADTPLRTLSKIEHEHKKEAHLASR